MISLPWSEIMPIFNEIVTELTKQIELPGFRKGMVPQSVAQKHIDRKKVLEEVIKKIIPQSYTESIKQLGLHPIITPRVELLDVSEGKDWQIKITSCEKPAVTLGNYTQTIENLKNSKKASIWVPGKSNEDKPKEPTVGELLDALFEAVTVDLGDLLVEQETNRLLSNTFSELQKLGVSLDEYLRSQGKTSDQLRSDYTKQAYKTLSLEFALEEIADKEGITVENQEIEEVIQKAKSEAEKQALAKERYFLGSLLRRQKTLTTLLKTPVVTA